MRQEAVQQALAAGRRVAGKRKCAVVSGGNIDATVLAGLLSDIRPRPPRKPRRRSPERLRSGLPGRTNSPAFPHTSPIATAVEETPR